MLLVRWLREKRGGGRVEWRGVFFCCVYLFFSLGFGVHMRSAWLMEGVRKCKYLMRVMDGDVNSSIVYAYFSSLSHFSKQNHLFCCTLNAGPNKSSPSLKLFSRANFFLSAFSPSTSPSPRPPLLTFSCFLIRSLVLGSLTISSLASRSARSSLLITALLSKLAIISAHCDIVDTMTW